MKKILDLINAAVAAGELDKNAARAAGIALGFVGDDAMLAVRVLADGADPASLEFLAYGRISDPIRLAHGRGPGSLVGEDRDEWLLLTAASVDESKVSTFRERVQGFTAGLLRMEAQESDGRVRAADIQAQAARVAALPYTTETICGRAMRVYGEDLGFAAAYWAGEPCAAVRGTGIMFVASSGTPLATIGVTIPEVGQRGPCFSVLSEDGTRGLPRA